MVEERPSWKTEHRLGDWELTIFATDDDYSLLTDFELESPHSGRYLGTIGTPEMVRNIIDKPGEQVPFWMSDLILVDSLSEESLLAAVRALIDQGEVERALDLVPPDAEELMPKDSDARRLDNG